MSLYIAHVTYSSLNKFPIEKYIKKLIGEREIEDALQKLNRLSLSEDRARSTQILVAVYELLGDLKRIINGVCQS